VDSSEEGSPLSYEAPHLPPDPAHGERLDGKTGAIIARLPVKTRPCTADPDSVGRHPVECFCSGTGQVVIREPNIASVDAADDGLESLADALQERDENGNRYNPYMGASTESLMKQPADGVKHTGGKSGSSGKKKPKCRRVGNEKPPRKWADGQREITGHTGNKAELAHQKAVEKAQEEAELLAPRTGRRGRFGGPVRVERVNTSIDPATKAGLREMNSDLATLVNGIMTEPESLAVVLEARVMVAKETRDKTFREIATYELRRRAGETVEMPKGGITRIRARLTKCQIDIAEAEAMLAASRAAVAS
jgi:hypothetical protein